MGQLQTLSNKKFGHGWPHGGQRCKTHNALNSPGAGLRLPAPQGAHGANVGKRKTGVFTGFEERSDHFPFDLFIMN